MFTGLIEELAVVAALQPLPQKSGQRLRLRAALLDEVQPLGASLAINGVCLTVVSAVGGEVEVEVGPETLSRTNLAELRVGQKVHLERALRLSDRLGGHLVSGHVDGVGEILGSARRGDSWDVRVSCPSAILRYIIDKGAIAIDGLSLTVNQLDGHGFSVSLVPYTQQRVNLHRKSVGETVNLEVDMIGKYVEKLLAPYSPTVDRSLTLQKLKEHGFV
jgi:riboflavin synthase